MDSVVIYIFGHLDVFKGILQALAVLFDPTQTEFFVSNDGMGLGVGATLAAVVALLGAGLNWFDTQKFAPHTALYGVVLYSLFFVPKMDEVWVSDLYTGRTEVVNNVPLGVSLLGYAYSTISLGIARNFETQYTMAGAVDGMTYSNGIIGNGGASGNGFLSPLKALVFFRHNTFSHISHQVKYNLTAYQLHCLNASHLHGDVQNTVNFQEMQASETPFVYYFDTAFIKDRTVIAMKPNGEQFLSGCNALNAELSGDASSVGSILFELSNSSSMGVYGYKALATKDNFEAYLSSIQAGGALDTNTSLGEMDTVLTSILKNSVNSQNFMKAALARDMAKYAKGFAGLSPEAFADYSTTMTTTIENSKMLQAVEGEEYLHWSMTAMSALQFLFYALSPIVGIALVAKGAGSFKYFGGYLLFGLWVYSWIPVATAINFWSIGGFMEAFNAQDGVFSMTPEMVDIIVEQGETAIAVGANLLAMTPLITFAIISSGGGYAMTQLSQAAAPKGGASQAAANLTPQLRDNPSVTSTKSLNTQASAGSFVGGATHAVNELSSYKFGNQFSQSQASSIGQNYIQGYENKHSAAKEAGFQSLHAFSKSVGGTASVSSLEANGLRFSSGISAVEKSLGMKSGTFSTEDKNNISAGIHAGGGNFNSAFRTAIQKAKGSGYNVTEQDIDAAETAFLKAATVDTQVSSQSSNVNSQAHANSVNKNASDVAKTSEELSDKKAYQKEQSVDLAQLHQNSKAYAKDGLGLYSDISRNINDASWSGMEGYIGKAYKRAAIQQGHTHDQAQNMWNAFSKSVNEQFNNDKRFTGLEKDSASALGSYLTAFSRGDNFNAENNALLRDSERELLSQSSNSPLNGNKEHLNTTSQIEQNVKEGAAALTKQVDSGKTGIQSHIKSSTSGMKSATPFTRNELSGIHEGLGSLDKQFNAITHSDGQKYTDTFNNNLNSIAKEQYGVSSFSELKGNEARSVAETAALETANGFVQDLATIKNNKANSGSSSLSHFSPDAAENAFKATGAMFDAQSYTHEGKIDQKAGEMAFNNFGEAFKRESNSIASLTNAEKDVGSTKETIDKQSAQTSKKHADNQGGLSHSLFGKPGIDYKRLNTSEGNAPFSQFYENKKSGVSQLQNNENLDKQLLNSFNEDANPDKHNVKTLSTELGDALGIDLRSLYDSGVQNNNNAIADRYNELRADYSAPQAYSIVASEFGSSSSGNFEDLTATVLESSAIGTATGGVVNAAESILPSKFMGKLFNRGKGNKTEKENNAENPTPSKAKSSSNNNENKINSIGSVTSTIVTATGIAAGLKNVVTSSQNFNEAADQIVKSQSRMLANENLNENMQLGWNRGGESQENVRTSLSNLASSIGVKESQLYSENNGQLKINDTTITNYLRGDQFNANENETDRLKNLYDHVNMTNLDQNVIATDRSNKT